MNKDKEKVVMQTYESDQNPNEASSSTDKIPEEGDSKQSHPHENSTAFVLKRTWRKFPTYPSSPGFLQKVHYKIQLAEMHLENCLYLLEEDGPCTLSSHNWCYHPIYEAEVQYYQKKIRSLKRRLNYLMSA